MNSARDEEVKVENVGKQQHPLIVPYVAPMIYRHNQLNKIIAAKIFNGGPDLGYTDSQPS